MGDALLKLEYATGGYIVHYSVGQRLPFTPLATLEQKLWLPSFLIVMKVTPPDFGNTRTKMTRNIMPIKKTGYRA